jgi:hypothetical protein
MRKPPEFFGPATWALIREHYLTGATARTLSNRYGPSVDAIRQRISREGWRKIPHAEARDDARRAPAPPPPEIPAPGDVIPHHTPHAPGGSPTNPERVAPMHPSSSAASVSRAPPPASTPPSGRMTAAAAMFPRTAHEVLHVAAIACAEAIRDGRTAEASTLMRTARELSELVQQIGHLATPEELHGEPLDEGMYWPTMRTAITWTADVIDELFDPDPDQPCFKTRMVYDFRGRHLGPEVGAHDLALAKAQGWWRKVWDEDGVLMDPRPLSVVAGRGRGRRRMTPA